MIKSFHRSLTVEQALYILAGVLVVGGILLSSNPSAHYFMDAFFLAGVFTFLLTYAFVHFGYGAGLSLIVIPLVVSGCVAISMGAEWVGLGLGLGGVAILVIFFTIPVAVADLRDR